MSATLNIVVSGPEAVKLKEKIREEATRRGMSLSEFVMDCVLDYLERLHGKDDQ